MSCSCYPNPCCGSCVSSEIACADPGLETVGKHLAVLDDQFCLRRIPNAPGFVWMTENGIQASSDPQVQLTTLEVAENVEFGSLVINMGSNGNFRKVVPAAGVDGILRAQNGRLIFQDPSNSGFVVPDPLTLTQLNVSTLNATTSTFSGTTTFNNLPTDTVTQFVGLNGSNQLVKGALAALSVAQFYESVSFGSGATPNFTFPSTASSPVKVNNEITDIDGLAHAISDTDIQIDVAGWYIIDWIGQYSGYRADGGNSSGTSFRPALWLYINNILRDRGNVEGYQDRNVACTALGTCVQLMAAGDVIQLRGNGSMRSPLLENRGTGLQGVKLTLTKYR